MAFVAPRVVVSSQFAVGENVITRITGDPTPYSEPLAPAGLYDVATERREAFALHKLARHVGDSMEFKTYRVALPQSSLAGGHFAFRPWWTAKAWKLVTDTTLIWSRQKVP